jgi:hypothetical protein
VPTSCFKAPVQPGCSTLPDVLFIVCFVVCLCNGSSNAVHATESDVCSFGRLGGVRHDGRSIRRDGSRVHGGQWWTRGVVAVRDVAVPHRARGEQEGAATTDVQQVSRPQFFLLLALFAVSTRAVTVGYVRCESCCRLNTTHCMASRRDSFCVLHFSSVPLSVRGDNDGGLRWRRRLCYLWLALMFVVVGALCFGDRPAICLSVGGAPDCRQQTDCAMHLSIHAQKSLLCTRNVTHRAVFFNAKRKGIFLRNTHSFSTYRKRYESQQADREVMGVTQQMQGAQLTAEDPNVDLRSKSPQVVEMYTFRDAIDVNYQRMALTGEELSGVSYFYLFCRFHSRMLQVPLEDLKVASKELIGALRIREKYMRRIGHQFPSTTSHFLSGLYPNNLPKPRKKNTESSTFYHRFSIAICCYKFLSFQSQMGFNVRWQRVVLLVAHTQLVQLPFSYLVHFANCEQFRLCCDTLCTVSVERRDIVERFSR